MNKTHDLYVMISETDTGVGRIIRNLSHYRYNHVSVTTDPTLRKWYSFARFFENAPFYSGFIQEPVERFLARGYEVPVRIFRLEITPERKRTLDLLFKQAGQPDTGLRYNYYDAIAAVFGKKIDIPGAYTCLSFGCAVLEKSYMTIEELNEDLSEYLYYDGDLNLLVRDSGNRHDRYFIHISRLRCFWATACAMGNVTRRLIFNTDEDLIEERLHSTAH